MKPVTRERGYDEVLFGQGYQITGGAVIDGGMIISRRKVNKMRKDPAIMHITHHKNHFKSPGSDSSEDPDTSNLMWLCMMTNLK